MPETCWDRSYNKHIKFYILLVFSLHIFLANIYTFWVFFWGYVVAPDVNYALWWAIIHPPSSTDRCCTYCPAVCQIFYNRITSSRFYRLIIIMFMVLLFTDAKTICGGGGEERECSKQKQKNKKQKNERKQKFGPFLGWRPALLLRDCPQKSSLLLWLVSHACCYYITCLLDTPFLQKKQKKTQIRNPPHPTASTKCKPWNRCKLWA